MKKKEQNGGMKSPDKKLLLNDCLNLESVTVGDNLFYDHEATSNFARHEEFGVLRAIETDSELSLSKLANSAPLPPVTATE